MRLIEWQGLHSRPSIRRHGLWNEIDVADKLRAPVPALENDLTAMKGFEFGPMTNADNGRISSSLDKSSINRSSLCESSAAVASSSTMISGR